MLVNCNNFTAQEILSREVFTGQVGRATCTACQGTDNLVPGNLNHSGIENPSIDPSVGGAPVPLRLILTTDQKTARVGFLKPLTGHVVATDPKFQDPFEYGQ